MMSYNRKIPEYTHSIEELNKLNKINLEIAHKEIYDLLQKLREKVNGQKDKED